MPRTWAKIALRAARAEVTGPTAVTVAGIRTTMVRMDTSSDVALDLLIRYHGLSHWSESTSFSSKSEPPRLTIAILAAPGSLETDDCVARWLLNDEQEITNGGRSNEARCPGPQEDQRGARARDPILDARAWRLGSRVSGGGGEGWQLCRGGAAGIAWQCVVLFFFRTGGGVKSAPCRR